MLENKIPPPLVTLIFGFIAWLLSILFPSADYALEYTTIITASTVVIGFGFGFLGLYSFKKAKTTVNPLQPDKATQLVTSGIYQITRNPMYVGMVLLLIGICVAMANLTSFIVVPGLVLYMNKFQIKPEEKAMVKLFGDEFLSYSKQVRRWL